MSDFHGTRLIAMPSYRNWKFLFSIIGCWLVFSTLAVAQISASGWTPAPKPAGKKVPSISELAAKGEAPPSRKQENAGIIKIAAARLHQLPAPSAEQLRSPEDKKRVRVGINRLLSPPLGQPSDFTFYEVADGRIGLLRLRSEGGLLLRLRFANVTLPAGGSLFVYSAANRDEFFRIGSEDGVATEWTPHLTGDEAVVEYFLPKDADLLPAFQITELSHIFKDPRQQAADGKSDALAAAACQVDLTPEWKETAKSVALISFNQGAEFLCTGTLLNTTTNSGEPYVLTASHCVNDPYTAATVETYWLFDSSSGVRFTTPRNAILLTTSEATDATLLQLRLPVPAGVRYAGWTTATPQPGEAVTGIHHPGGDYKRISFGNIVNSQCPSHLYGDLCGNFVKVRWTRGVTEPGSSGSGIWTGSAADPKLAGTLLGGASACDNPSGVDFYGRFDLIFPAISYFLTKQGCLYSLSQTSNAVEAAAAQGTVKATLLEGEACNWTAESRASWITITAGATGAGDGTVSYSIAPNPGSSPRAGVLMIAGQPLLIRQGGNQTCTATSIAPGQSASGALNNSDCRSIIDPGSFADRYTFAGTAGQRLLFTLKSTAFDAYLTIIGPDGEIVAQNDDAGQSTDARIPADFGLFTLTMDGVYTVEVSTIEPGKTGGYTLTLSAPDACLWTPTKLRFVFGPNGELIENAPLNFVNCQFGTKVPTYPRAPWISYAYDYGSFTLTPNLANVRRTGVVVHGGFPLLLTQLPACTASEPLTITPTSQSIGPEGGTLTFNISQPRGASCVWRVTSTGIAYPSLIYGAGDRVLEVSVPQNWTLRPRTGVLTINGQSVTITQSTAINCQATPLALNQTLNGTLAPGDCATFTPGVLADHYSFSGVKNQQIAFILRSPDVEIQAQIFDPQGGAISGFSTFPGKELRLPSLIQGSTDPTYLDLPFDGTYTLVVSAPQPGASGTYSVNLTGIGGAGCSYLIGQPNYLNLPAAGGASVIKLTATGGCEWNATASESWISFPEGGAGSGSRDIKFNIAANNGAARNGFMRVAGRYFSVLQEASCSFVSVNAPDVVYVSAAGNERSKAFNVTTGPGCAWDVSPGADWAGYSGKEVFSDGFGYARFEIRLNEGPFRTTKAVVAGKTIEFRQAAGNVPAVSSASYGGTIAPGSIATIFGQELARGTEVAQSLPLPKTLAGARVSMIVIGQGGFDAPLFFVSPAQINFQVPENLPLGPTLIDVYSDFEVFSRGFPKVERIAPAIFTANASGQGLPAATVLRIKPDGTQSYEAIARFDAAQNKIVAVPIDLSGNDQVFLLLFGTGIRGRSALAAVGAKIGGLDAELLYAGAQGDLVGLDQVNLRLPQGLAGRGEIDLTLTVDDKMANTVKIVIK
jgi:uncharacterized protein (TIGR03437 family)